MMLYDIDIIRSFPTCLDESEILEQGPAGFHESVLRAYQILDLVKRLLELETHPSVVRWVIRQCEKGEQVE